MPDEDRQPGSWLDLAQSCLRLSWALSLLGANEVVSLIAGRAPGTRARGGSGFEAVRQAACAELSDPAREMFRAGDQIQRGMSETLAELVRQPPLDPRRLARTALDAGRRFARWAEAAPAAGACDPSAAEREARAERPEAREHWQHPEHPEHSG